MTVKHSRRHFYNFMVNLFIIHVNRHILAKNNCVSSEANICGTAVPALLCIVALLQRPVLMFRSVNMSTKNIEYMRCLRSAYACSVQQALIKGFRSSELEWKITVMSLQLCCEIYRKWKIMPHDSHCLIYGPHRIIIRKFFLIIQRRISRKTRWRLYRWVSHNYNMVQMSAVVIEHICTLVTSIWFSRYL